MGLFQKSTRKTEHETVEEQLSAYLDGELTAQERATVERHLATCEDCQWSLDTLRQTVQWTRELPTVQVPRVFTIPVPAQPERAPRWRWSLPVLQGATALVALLLVFVVAGDLMLGTILPGAVPESRMLHEQSVADVAVTETAAEAVVEEVIVEKELAPAVEEPAAPAEDVAVTGEAEKAAAEPLPQPTEVVEVEAEVVVTATDENSAMGAVGFESPPPGARVAVTETEGAGEARATAPEATLTEAAYATGGGQATETTPPTVAPTASPAPPPTIARPTVLAEAPPEAAVAPQRGEGAETWREPVAVGFDVAKVVLLVVFIVLATSTVVVMVRRRRVG